VSSKNKRAKRIGRIFVLVCLLSTVFLPAVLTEAQQAPKVPRIGFLSTLSRSAMADRIETFRQGLRDLGYVEGNNIVVEGDMEMTSLIA
jgi:putative tryptophan/tyrosine transport system substrate-binding protein